MNNKNQVVLALDVGEKRIGMAWADTMVRVATLMPALEMGSDADGHIKKIVRANDIGTIVIGLPRNQSGEETKQSQYVRDFAMKLDAIDVLVEFQDESLTSVIAEERLQNRGKKYAKADIDSEAAAIILTDYLEANYGK